MTDEANSANAPAAQFDAAEACRAKLVAVLLLNSRSKADLFEHIAHMGTVSEQDIPKLYHECVASLAHWKGLRRLGAAQYDADIDKGFCTAVEGLYAGLMEFLCRGVGSNRRMVKARKKALKYARQRCFVDDEIGERLVNSAADLMEISGGATPANWIAEDPHRKPPPDPAAVVEPTVLQPVAPPVPDNRSPIEKAADRLYGHQLSEATPEARPSDDVGAAGNPSMPEGVGEAEVQRILEQATLLRALTAWTRQEIAEDLLKHEVLENLPDAFEFIESVFRKFADARARVELLTSAGGEVGDQYASGITEAMQTRHLLIKGLKDDKDYSRDDLVAALKAMLDVPESFAEVLIEMTESISKMTGGEQ